MQHSDRLARGDAVKGAHLVEVALWAIKAGVTVKSIQDPRACETILDAALMGMRNNEDSERKSKATADGVRRAVERGQWCAGVVPAGYEVLRGVDDRGRVARTVVKHPEDGEKFTTGAGSCPCPTARASCTPGTGRATWSRRLAPAARRAPGPRSGVPGPRAGGGVPAVEAGGLRPVRRAGARADQQKAA